MGEAKRRKINDPTYGVIPKKTESRGLVICPPMEVEGSNLRLKMTGLHPQEVRFALLFWDRLVWPSSRGVHIASGPDEEFLEGVGILSRPDYTMNGDQANALAAAQVKAFLDLQQSEPGLWALSLGENSLVWKDANLSDGAGTLIELHRAIPIPKHDVPFAEILEFKERRRDELSLLRLHLEAFASTIEKAQDREEAFYRHLDEIDKACANLLLVGKEWQFPMYLSNIKSSFSISPFKLLPALAGGWKIGEPYGLAAATAASAFAGGMSMIEVKSDLGFRSLNSRSYI